MANTIKEDTGDVGQLELTLIVTKCECKYPVYVIAEPPIVLHAGDATVDPNRGLTLCCGEDWELLA